MPKSFDRPKACKSFPDINAKAEKGERRDRFHDGLFFRAGLEERWLRTRKG